eukprot:GHUV01031193.1.p1 GENE.GHUV01031193.1~~GHUV01031193.1.p1  ORF type:complete len:134 (+),score=24.25 GHUV01031193.1:375-776(+)
MAAVPPHPSTVHDAAAAAGYAAPHQQHPVQANVQSLNQSAEFFLSNYRLGRTLGIGSFGKVRPLSWALLLGQRECTAAMPISSFVAENYSSVKVLSPAARQLFLHAAASSATCSSTAMTFCCAVYRSKSLSIS